MVGGGRAGRQVRVLSCLPRQVWLIVCQRFGGDVCQKKKKKSEGQQPVREVSENEDAETDSDVVNRLFESRPEYVNATGQNQVTNKTAKLQVTALDHGTPSDTVDMLLLIDSGVNKSLLNESDWNKLAQGSQKVKIKRCRVNFTSYGTKIDLPMLGRSKATMVASSGAMIITIVYVVKGQK